MYSDDDLDAAIEAGVLEKRAVHAFRGFMEARQDGRLADEEHFRLLTGFNDIFVSIAVALVLVGVITFGLYIGLILILVGVIPSENLISSEDLMNFGVASFFCAGTSWLLGEYFIRRRRMALPSILLLFGFVGGVFFFGLSLGSNRMSIFNSGGGWLIRTDYLILFASVIAAGSAWLHWRRFKVPITIATGTIAVCMVALWLAVTLIPNAEQYLGWLILLAGLCVFAFAMKWDSSDRTRSTRRSDVAFWLHFLAAGMIVHPVFALLPSAETTAVGVAVVLAVYAVLAVVALIVDRRPILVSALAYVLYTVTGAVSSSDYEEEIYAIDWALIALPIGSALLLFSAFWPQARRWVVRQLPDGVRARVPEVS